MLRKIRLTLAVLFFTFITLLFLDFTGTLHSWFGWMAKIQFLPAVLALNVGVILLLVALTLVFGRVYCSVICPLGVFQDVVSWISGRRKKGKYRFTYSPAKNVLRYGVLALFVIALIAGIGSFVALLAPYSSYGRIASNLFAPIYGWGNNALAYLAERADSYAFYETSVWLKSLPTFIVAALTFIIISVLAWRNGRTYACIDGKNHTVDYSRCVACMDCIDTCRHGAISFGLRRKKETVAKQPVNAGQIDDARRSFLTATAIVATAATVKAQEKKVDGGLAVIEDKKIPERATPIVPPGAWSARDFARHCTACQLCVSVCPNEVLRPSTDLMKLMQPEMSYERGYCRPECTKCGDVCPAGAIRPITVAEKSATQIGHAVWVKENCVPLTDGVECGNCARHCPTGAIQMVPSDPSDAESPKIPVVNTERCIGCGACENLCPARPFSAIYVEGHEVHRVV